MLILSLRAGCNFSAISGTDANALRWDKKGYSHLAKLASDKPDETFVSWTPSTELWDEDVPTDKIKHMSEYLEDVWRMITLSACGPKLTHATVSSIT